MKLRNIRDAQRKYRPFSVSCRASSGGCVGSLVQQRLVYTPAIRAALDVTLREKTVPAPGFRDNTRCDATHE